ncbi:MAG: molecular chaperone DnaJ [Halobacteria archaeon]
MAANGRDYYDVLGVPRGATPEQIKKAYRELVKKHHPDVAKDKRAAEEKFKEISEAYEVLGDERKRAAYDQMGRAGVDFGSGGFTWDRFTRWGDIEDLFPRDLFESLLGRGAFETLFGAGGPWAASRRPGGPEEGADVEVPLDLTLEEVARGAAKEVALDLEEPCGRCGGSRREPGTAEESCRSCGGRGQVRSERRTAFGYFATVTTCPKCGGAGASATPCRGCRGRGRVRGRRTVTLQVPPGVEDGVRLRLAGQGEAGLRGGGAGDLYARVRVLPHPRFSRRGEDLAVEISVPFPTAALGGEAEVPTLDGPAKLRVPPGTPGGALLTLKGRGLPRFGRSGRGDLRATVRISVPESLTRRQRKALEEFRESLEE